MGRDEALAATEPAPSDWGGALLAGAYVDGPPAEIVIGIENAVESHVGELG